MAPGHPHLHHPAQNVDPEERAGSGSRVAIAWETGPTQTWNLSKTDVVTGHGLIWSGLDVDFAAYRQLATGKVANDRESVELDREAGRVLDGEKLLFERGRDEETFFGGHL